MNNSTKNIIQKWMMSCAQRFYWRYINNFFHVEYSNEQINGQAILQCIVSYNRYGGYCVPNSSKHRFAARKILANDVYEPKTIELIRSNCGDGDIIHAGTYFGDFLPALAGGVSPDAKVWAFEPNLENYRCARITLEINGIENVILANAGLGSKPENLLVKTSDENGRSLGGSSRIIKKGSKEVPGTETVQIVTIDNAVPSDRNVSLIQLDVEGYEKEALIGGLDTIRRCLPIIILEDTPNSALLNSDWFAENIIFLGYRKVCDVHRNSVFSRDR